MTSGGRDVRGVKWIFFDIGSTLVDETEAYAHRIRDMIAGTDISFDEFYERMKALAAQGLDGHAEAIRFYGLRKMPWHTEDETPFADAEETLAYLQERGYRLGIIANQSPGAAKRLDRWGLLKYFDRIASSAELGVSKPDRKIFETALAMAACRPEEAAMVGDRLDNDIIPARAIGMKTVWMRKGLSGHRDPEYGNCPADWLISALSDMRGIF